MKSKDKQTIDKVSKNLEAGKLKSLASFIWLENKGKKRDIDKMLKQIERNYLDSNNEVKATIVSKEELSGPERQEIEQRLKDKTNKKISAEYEISESLIGGIKIIFEGEVIDYSLKGRVDALRDKIRG